MRIIYSCLLIAIALTGTQQCVAQYGTFGEDTCPEDSAAVDDIIYYGELLDMSGGYLTGDTVFDFTVYDFDGNPLNLYTELSGEKPVVLINGSVSCLRFRGTFEPDNNGQQYVAARNYLEEHINDYNWIFIYGVEAHPTDGNCPSNCPPTVSNDTTVVQPPFYVDRRWAVRGWEDSPEHDFPFTMYADNPNNAVYNNFFQRPFGLVAINCDGTVALRGDWVNSFFMDATNVTALNEWRLESDACTIDWTPDDGTDDDGTDDDGTDDDGTDDDGTDDDGTDDDGTDDDGTDDDGTDDDGTDDDGTDDDGTDDDGTDDDGTDDDGTDDDGTDDDGTDDDGTDDDDTPLDDGPSLALTGGNQNNEVVSNSFIEAPSNLKIYPNPAQDLLQIEGLENAARVLLIDISGRELMDVESTDQMLRIDASAFSPGPYILIVLEESKAPQRRTLVIQ